MTNKHVIILVLLVAASCAALHAQANIELQDVKDEEAALEVEEGTMGGTDECQYIMQLKTGNRLAAGTASKLIFKFYDNNNNGGQPITKAVQELIGSGTLTKFEFKDKCKDRLCFLSINSDWKAKWGVKPDWYCEWVSITIKRQGRKTFTHKFKVDEWLGPKPLIPGIDKKQSLEVADCAAAVAAS